MPINHLGGRKEAAAAKKGIEPSLRSFLYRWIAGTAWGSDMDSVCDLRAGLKAKKVIIWLVEAPMAKTHPPES